MAKLTEEQKLFIITHLACFDSPSQVADAFNDEFGTKIDRRHVEEYDPAKRSPGKKWRIIFAAAQKKFLEEVGAEPAAHRAYRVRRRAAMARRAEKKGNYSLANDLFTEIAKEMGNAYTNRREITGKGGGPIATRALPLENMTRAELAALAVQLAAGDESAG